MLCRKKEHLKRCVSLRVFDAFLDIFLCKRNAESQSSKETAKVSAGDLRSHMPARGLESAFIPNQINAIMQRKSRQPQLRLNLNVVRVGLIYAAYAVHVSYIPIRMLFSF